MSGKAKTPVGMQAAALLGALAVAAGALWSCDPKGYQDPTASIITTKTSTPLIDAATLKQWHDLGLVNAQDPAARDRVVILEVTDQASYDAGHVDGAQLFATSTLSMTRLEGLAPAGSMVIDGPSIDAIIQRTGIDENTTVVFTTAKTSSAYYATRAYWTFLYWGFPAARLKVLDGFDKDFAVQYPDLMSTTATSVAASTYSVQDLGATNPGLRMSIGEMIGAVKAGTYAIIDARGNAATSSYNGTSATGSLLPAQPGTFTVFDGHMVGAVALAQGSLFDATTGKYKDVATVTGLFQGVGVDGTKPIIVHCTSGYSCSTEFFFLSGVLGWQVAIYDGSWSQWGQYAGNTTLDVPATAANGGSGAFNTLVNWRTDSAALSALVTYNAVSNGKALSAIAAIPLDPVYSQMCTSPSDPRANQIENADSDYAKGGAAATPTGGTGGSGTTGGGC